MFLEVVQCSWGSTMQYQGSFRPICMEVACLGLLPQRSLTHVCLVLQRSLAWAYSLISGSLIPAPVEVAASGGGHLFLQMSLLPRRSLTGAWSHRCLWFRPAPSVVTPLYLLLWRSLLRACSNRALISSLLTRRLMSYAVNKPAFASEGDEIAVL